MFYTFGENKLQYIIFEESYFSWMVPDWNEKKKKKKGL